MPACLACKGDLEEAGAYVTTQLGPLHAECFTCMACGVNLSDGRGFLAYQGDFACSMPCRAKAARDPSLIRQYGSSWRSGAGWTKRDAPAQN
ncbi:hypothetical protein H696_05046 [Fonticula alba]|uniref:LIM zinc-binding domain-containing protein n=1 Tax=Fonticula alba TaxID=691883 RepID=A0A058Z5E9_FONAL|nr:hypothetical protein H696_05046 [Fonticula alba]KCV68762.1 hypothetical protein H696_05046 [Fonticula alba]|eukprot:XP_009497194.1 hypothetical protein H696_05046 [Fonticula alba]